MDSIFGFVNRVWDSIKTTLRLKAAADVEAGAKILAQAQAEADEMERAAKELDQALSTTPNTVPPKP